MDSANFEVAHLAVKSFDNCMAGLAGPWERLRVAGQLLDVLRARPWLRSSPEVIVLEKEAEAEYHAAPAELSPSVVSPPASPFMLLPASLALTPSAAPLLLPSVFPVVSPSGLSVSSLPGCPDGVKLGVVSLKFQVDAPPSASEGVSPDVLLQLQSRERSSRWR